MSGREQCACETSVTPVVVCAVYQKKGDPSVDTPIDAQGCDSSRWGESGGEEAVIVLSDRCTPDALKGIEAFSHVEVLFVFGARHPRNNPDWPSVGILAPRAKYRPDRIGSTICRVLRVDGIRLYVAELDAIL